MNKKIPPPWPSPVKGEETTPTECRGMYYDRGFESRGEGVFSFSTRFFGGEGRDEGGIEMTHSDHIGMP